MDSGREQIGASKAAGQNKTQPVKSSKPAGTGADLPTTKKATPIKGAANKGGGGNLPPMLASVATPTEGRGTLLRKIILWQSLIIFVLTATLTYAKFNIPRDPIPFAINTSTAQPKRLVALPGPTQTQQAIMSWVGATSADILNFGFHNVIERLDSTRKYFTDNGWDSFVEAVTNSEIISNITAKQQVITAAPTGTPVILRTDPHPFYGRQWVVQVPIYVTVLSGQNSSSRRRTLTLTLVSVPPYESLNGLGIERWIDR